MGYYLFKKLSIHGLKRINGVMILCNVQTSAGDSETNKVHCDPCYSKDMEKFKCVPREVGEALHSVLLTVAMGITTGIEVPHPNSYVEFLTLSTSGWDLFGNRVITDIISQDVVIRVDSNPCDGSLYREGKFGLRDMCR